MEFTLSQPQGGRRFQDDPHLVGRFELLGVELAAALWHEKPPSQSYMTLTPLNAPSRRWKDAGLGEVPLTPRGVGDAGHLHGNLWMGSDCYDITVWAGEAAALSEERYKRHAWVYSVCKIVRGN